MSTRAQILVRGIVQGVGFRPFVYLHASRRSLAGRVRNSTTGVVIDVQGEETQIEEFVREIGANPPPLSLIESIECHVDLSPADYSDFRIVESSAEGKRSVPISADVATCLDCLNELFDPTNRRHRYPFINCTNCGPRFTIIETVPYDRPNTTMKTFEMCASCLAEYQDPTNRRFHAEPTACAVCGPRVKLLDSLGTEIVSSEQVINEARRQLLKGKILAIKGLGGFHLACNALITDAVEQLRRRKFRDDKPFALMAESLSAINAFCTVSDKEAELLTSVARPIVLLKGNGTLQTAGLIAPRIKSLGFMLPYTPLHHLLLKDLGVPLVMTSGNISDEPICFRDAEAAERLYGIADYFLTHNRSINIRTDDSVARVVHDKPVVLRRSRGYAPAPIKTSFEFGRSVLACGAELKNTFCLGRGCDAFISHHIGDLENLETLKSFTEGIEHFQELFAVEPEIVAYDLHPEYLSTKFALTLDHIPMKLGIQHHHAHIASCMADNGIDGPVIGVAMDGLGFGVDGKLWGGEFLVADFLEAERFSHLAYVPLPGGSKAIREPWRVAAVYLQRALGRDFHTLDLSFNHRLKKRGWPTLNSMIAANLNSPETSSVGRLFDAIASIVGLRDTINYEGQAAIELEGIAEAGIKEEYQFELSDDGNEVMATGVIRSIVNDLMADVPASKISAKFHAGMSALIVRVVERIRQQYQLNRVVLSGGVFQNVILLETVCSRLRERYFEVFTHGRVPTNDGGISLGQAAIANARFISGRIN